MPSLSALLSSHQLKMRAGGMSESTKWKKQKRSPRPPRHLVRSPSAQTDAAAPSTLSNNNLSGSSVGGVLLSTFLSLNHCVSAHQAGSRSLSKARPPPASRLQTVLPPPFQALQLRRAAWRPVPRPPPEKTCLTWSSAAHLQSAPTGWLLSQGLRLALRMHRYNLPTLWSGLVLSRASAHGSCPLVPSVRADMLGVPSRLQWSPFQRFWKTKTL